jgi:Ca2+-binding EF-hand superfamily protein
LTSNYPQAFRAFDKNNSGIMSTQELMTVMRSFGEALQATTDKSPPWHHRSMAPLIPPAPASQDDEVDEMLKAASSCEVKPGHVDYRQFTKVLLK